MQDKLASLIQYKHIISNGGYHRALFDAEMTTKLWLVMLNDISERYDISAIPFELILKVSKKAKNSVHKYLMAQQLKFKFFVTTQHLI